MSGPLHAAPDNSEPALLDQEPVSIVQAVHMVLAALVALGWATIDNATIDIIGSAVAALLSVGAQLWARRKVTPAANPRTTDGQTLTPDEPMAG
jgi:hypothetical protein